MFSTLSCATVVLIFAIIIVIIVIIAIIAIAVWIVLIQQESHLICTDPKLGPVSEDCSAPFYGWLHKNDSCPANPDQPEDGTV